MTDSIELRKVIADRGISIKRIAEILGLSAYGLTLKIDGKREFKASEVKALCDVLGITSLRERERIFFANEADYKST